MRSVREITLIKNVKTSYAFRIKSRMCKYAVECCFGFFSFFFLFACFLLLFVFCCCLFFVVVVVVVGFFWVFALVLLLVFNNVTYLNPIFLFEVEQF